MLIAAVERPRAAGESPGLEPRQHLGVDGRAHGSSRGFVRSGGPSTHPCPRPASPMEGTGVSVAHGNSGRAHGAPGASSEEERVGVGHPGVTLGGRGAPHKLFISPGYFMDIKKVEN